MKFNLQEHVKSGRLYKDIRYPALPITCKNGLKLSIQASKFHYSVPRDNEGPYTHFEVGFPSMDIEDLKPYGDEEGKIFSAVPGLVIANVLHDAGGVVSIGEW
jgi:hypothetical protein